jgi:hypothetical protein
MAEIVGFDGGAAAWRVLEAEIRFAVAHFGYGKEVADLVVQDLKCRTFRLQHYGAPIEWDEFPPESRPKLAATINNLKDAYEKLTGEWLVEIVKLECELWAAKTAAKPEGV